MGKYCAPKKRGGKKHPNIYSVFFFYEYKSICSFDPLKMLSGRSIISQNLRLARTFNKNTARIYILLFL